MITRAIVEEVMTKYLIKVRIPLLNRSLLSNVKTQSKDLNSGVICTLPQFDPNIQKGDVVIVGFEDNDQGKPIVLGYLYRKNMGDTCGDLVVNELKTIGPTHLSDDTHIGDVLPNEVQHLKGVTGNIQGQLDLIMDKINAIMQQIE